MFHEAAGTPVATWTRAYTYGVGTNRLATNSIPGGTATYSHDAHGNLTSMPHLAAITYSPWDQMASADLGGGGDVYFTYASDGTRVRKVWQQTATAVKERIYLGAYEIYREKLSGVTQLERHTLHIMDGVQRIAMVETQTIEGGVPIATPVPKYRFQLGNHLGSAMLEVDETGLIISYEEYHPYGTSAYRSARSGVEVSARRYRYTGKERDEETGLYYHGARYYAAWLGRWTSADPLGIGADGPGLYNYTRGSPIVYSDPSGTDSVDDQAATVAAHQQLAEQEYHRYLAEQYVQHDLETGQTIDPSIGVEVPEAVHPQVAFANEILANIDARLAAERAAALTGEGGASSGLAEIEARDPFAGASGQSAQPNEIGPLTDAELGFWQTLGGAYLGARIPSGPAHAAGALTLASAESHDDPSFVLGTLAVLPGMPGVSQALDRATGAVARRVGGGLAIRIDGPLITEGELANDLAWFGRQAEELHTSSASSGSALSEGPFVPPDYWSRYAPKQVAPGVTRLDFGRVSGRTGAIEESRVIYDEFGRQSYRVDKTTHLRPDVHTNPHLHEFQYGPGFTPYRETVHNFFRR